VYDTIIINNTAGMTMDHCSNTTFFNNIFSGNGLGCFVYATLNSSLHHNLFIKNEFGIRIYVDNAIVIHQNEFINNTIGICIFNSQGATIQKNNFLKNNAHATYERKGSIWHFFTLFKYKQKWSSNYWDDWQKTSPRPIRGSFVILVRILPIPLGIIGIPFPSYEYDRTPALTPYDIGG
jgi:parallel beta-helix repeat protein